MDPKTFEELRRLISERYNALVSVASLSPGYLSEKGKLVYEVFDDLEYLIYLADSLEEFVSEVSQKIKNYKELSWYDTTEIVKYLRKFVRVNVKKEIWENIPEFASKKENK